MNNLFDVENPASGFRMTSLEIFNWGTFDSKVWRLNPNGKSSLLTGGNGSGKTTLADAVITLLVPPARRFYNQSSGAERKKERSESTYVLGAYKSLRGESELTAKTSYLRNKDDFSILLAVFRNSDAGETVTLAQVRWHANNNLKRVFIVSQEELGIRKHFYPLDTAGGWKKRLKEKYRAEFYDSFAQYSRKFSKFFGFRSDKALSLFSQTVGIKDIENLNSFIRKHMLEETNVEEHFRKLRDNYDSLLISHNAIEKARTQVELLEPIEKRNSEYQTVSEKVTRLDNFKEILPYYFAQKENVLLETAARDGDLESEKMKSNIDVVKGEISDLEDEKETLLSAIGGNEATGQIRNLETRIGFLNKEKDDRQQEGEAYSRCAGKLGFTAKPNEKIFQETAEAIKKRQDKNRKRIEELTEKEKVNYACRLTYEKDFNKLADELAVLRKRNSNIPNEYQMIQKQIADHLGVSGSEIPFAGELIAVKASESMWEKTIESILRNFGLSLLIKDSHSNRVNRFLDDHNIEGRISYLNVSESNPPSLFDEVIDESLISKISIKLETGFSSWLNNYLSVNYQYFLTNDLEAFNRHKKAGTVNTLVKYRNYHEKDDRKEIADRGNYILGWDNREKIKFIEKQANRLNAGISEIDNERVKNGNLLKSLEADMAELQTLNGFRSFDKIDAAAIVLEIQALISQKEKLLAESDKLRELEKQLEAVKYKQAGKVSEKEELLKKNTRIDDAIRGYQDKITKNKTIIDQARSICGSDNYDLFSSFAEKAGSANLSTIDEKKELVSSKLDREIRQESAVCSKLQTALVRSMQEFRSPDEDIRAKFPDWSSETTNLKADIEYISEYLGLYERIKKEDLPIYKKRFKKYLNEQVIFDIANFKTTLDNQMNSIRDNIRQINSTLKDIDYNNHPVTYIELTETPEKDTRVRAFNEMLKTAIPDAARVQRGDEQELEFAFNNIREVIENLSEDTDKRKYVTDVRNWLTFAATEKYRADGIQAHYYEDSQSLSGGEKAKLAYTILASALAYQFGISSSKFNIRSFRFVVVDEAFSKVDPENSIYAMELFKKLNLQVMLITPLDKINLAEKYIHSVHYAENKNKQNSAVYDLTMEEYYREKNR